MQMNKNLARITELVTAVDETPEFLGAVCPPTFETTVFKYRDFETVEALGDSAARDDREKRAVLERFSAYYANRTEAEDGAFAER